MNMPPVAWLDEARRNLPRYTSYPTALKLEAADGDALVRSWLQAVQPCASLSVYAHVPFCDRLCWYCGCHTSIVHQYDRVAGFHAQLLNEVGLWRDAIAPAGGIAHLHFGGGSPNALRPEHFAALVTRITGAFGLRQGAEIAAELDPGLLTRDFAAAAAEAGLTRASLGVQTFDLDVQRKVNRIQPLERVARSVEALRDHGVGAINFDLMYGLPGQTPENVAESARLAIALAPDRFAVFGYAHVPWMKKHQVMIREAELADTTGRWAQAEAADEVLTAAGYVRIGLDHYARPSDALARAAVERRLRRNFQGYTDDPAPVLVPLGPSAIGRFAEGLAQNHTATDAWARAIEAGRLPVAKVLTLSEDDRLRAAVIERLMCNLAVNVGAIAEAHGFAEDALDRELASAAPLADEGLCSIEGRIVTVPQRARRLVRAVAACFDADLSTGPARHAKAV